MIAILVMMMKTAIKTVDETNKARNITMNDLTGVEEFFNQNAFSVHCSK